MPEDTKKAPPTADEAAKKKAEEEAKKKGFSLGDALGEPMLWLFGLGAGAAGWALGGAMWGLLAAVATGGIFLATRGDSNEKVAKAAEEKATQDAGKRRDGLAKGLTAGLTEVKEEEKALEGLEKKLAEAAFPLTSATDRAKKAGAVEAIAKQIITQQKKITELQQKAKTAAESADADEALKAKADELQKAVQTKLSVRISQADARLAAEQIAIKQYDEATAKTVSTILQPVKVTLPDETKELDAIIAQIAKAKTDIGSANNSGLVSSSFNQILSSLEAKRLQVLAVTNANATTSNKAFDEKLETATETLFKVHGLNKVATKNFLKADYGKSETPAAPIKFDEQLDKQLNIIAAIVDPSNTGFATLSAVAKNAWFVSHEAAALKNIKAQFATINFPTMYENDTSKPRTDGDALVVRSEGIVLSGSSEQLARTYAISHLENLFKLDPLAKPTFKEIKSANGSTLVETSDNLIAMETLIKIYNENKPEDAPAAAKEEFRKLSEYVKKVRAMHDGVEMTTDIVTKGTEATGPAITAVNKFNNSLEERKAQLATAIETRKNAGIEITGAFEQGGKVYLHVTDTQAASKTYTLKGRYKTGTSDFIVEECASGTILQNNVGTCKEFRAAPDPQVALYLFPNEINSLPAGLRSAFDKVAAATNAPKKTGTETPPPPSKMPFSKQPSPPSP